MSHILHNLEIPILPAPMAGGPTTAEVVNAAAAAGSMGTLAWGTISTEGAQAQLGDVHLDTFGINLFAKQPELDSHAVDIAQELAAAEGVELKPVNFSNGWDEKLQLALDAAKQPGAKSPSVVWSMFGTFTTSEVKQLHAAGIEAWTTVTTEHEARAAIAAGVDALCVQGPEAGGHRGVWNPTAEPDKRPLPELIDAIAALTDLPLIAAGGLRSADDVHAVLELPGVKAVSCGSALLLTEEAGTSELNRQRIEQVSGQGEASTSTRAFSGRYARGLKTTYTEAHSNSPAIYPYLNQIFAARRAAGDEDVAYCLVGIEAQRIFGGTVASVLRRLWEKQK
ncbi:nitronate monooxygenase [Corynebacterium ammoniagenes]|uniref:Propionate 3-nitronate monooxygenase n=1 Tax=Corynebacterium ammoniagenes DSM 20306 TaxID=649754 RepID=A0ABN0AGL7_CORAM|nr:nitronate monooxygenase [Corynebacterium ammoniagenes]APT83074.1 dioxygenase [Corynebacterium ammoniagenes DSM 20306]AQS74107.1 2-nitropropane dioxygenase [Corynebacterium ammoniagenes]EFG82012.1 oxidoreductase, 2-nitropropane dioxygenase family protein [Corynebacterium ammoniagenes DSM 20306]